MRLPFCRLVAASLLAATAALPVLAATPSTQTGQISVAQVMAMLDQAGKGGVAAQVLQAYLGGVGESTGVLVSAPHRQGRPHVTCDRPMNLDAGTVRSVLRKAAPDRSSWGETAATPLLVSALVTRAGCR